MTVAITNKKAVTGPPRPSRIPPLQWWRGERRLQLDASDIGDLRKILSKIHLLEFPRWPEAVGGNGVAAACIGIYVGADRQSPVWLIDHVGSVLLMCAAEGSHGASLVLRHLRRRHGRGRRPSLEA